MKNLIITLIVFFIISNGYTQIINFEKDQCSRCNMLIADRNFAAYATDRSNKTQKFDAIECLINYIKTKDESDFIELKIANYTKPGDWIDANKATFLKSKNIPSPMGAYLSAYPDMKSALKVQKQMGGEILNWIELKDKFKNSNFGSFNHPDHHHKPGSYAPIGIMGDHLHHQGGWMISFRHMYMGMEGIQIGSNDMIDDRIYDMYMAAPQNMRMQMYMLGVMYAPSDNLTFSIMQSFIANKMSMRMEMPQDMGMDNMPMSPMYMD